MTTIDKKDIDNIENLNKIPEVTYGSKINSNYQNQDLALSKHFNVIG